MWNEGEVKLVPRYSRRSLLIFFGGIVVYSMFAPFTRFARKEVSNKGIANAYLSQWGLPPVIRRKIGLKLARTTPQLIVASATLFAQVDGYEIASAGCFQKNLSLVIKSLRRKISQE